MIVYLDQKEIRLNPSKSIGKGGEADVFDIGSGMALKIFKPPSHIDYEGLPQEQTAAKERIIEHQKKLKSFPRGMPGKVINPLKLATDKNGNKVLGYAMKYLRNTEALFQFGEKSFRQGGVSSELVMKVFIDLYETIQKIHERRVVIGDFNDLNVLVDKEEAYIIDTDSFQFGQFKSRMFTQKFVDPLLCNKSDNGLMLVKPHNELSDWYAYAVMLMRSLLFVGPYGGVYRPKDKNLMVPQDLRPLKRITVFDKEVRYPKPALALRTISDDVLSYFYDIFVTDKREIFSKNLLENIRWTRCTNCGYEHARNKCPSCNLVAPAAIKEVIQVRGKVVATRKFRTKGQIVFATSESGNLQWLYYENGKFYREDGRVIIEAKLKPMMRFRINAKSTLLAEKDVLVSFENNKKAEKTVIDTYGNLPMFDLNSKEKYWLQNGQLMREGNLGSEYVGDMLPGQTLFWIGEKKGFGFYRAGHLSSFFSFNVGKRGLKEIDGIPTISGQILDSTCIFSDDNIWFFTSTMESGRAVNRCFLIRGGAVIASASEDKGGDSWLGNIRGKFAANNFLLSATDDGVVRIDENGTKLSLAKSFPDTANFVDSDSHIFGARDGLWLVNKNEVIFLKIN